MSSRYADDIKRIVGIDPNQSSLGDAELRSPLGKARGIGYRDPASGATESASGTPGQTQAPEVPDGDLGDNSNQQGNNSQNPNDPLNGAVDIDNAGVSVEDIIDGTAPESKLQSPTEGPDGLQWTGPGLYKITDIHDCDTGSDLEIITLDQHVAPSGLIENPSNGEQVQVFPEWTSPDTLPTSSWLENYYVKYAEGIGLNFNEEYHASTAGFSDYLNSFLAPYKNDPDKTVTLLDIVDTYGDNGTPEGHLSSVRLQYDVDPSPGVLYIGWTFIECPAMPGSNASIDVACAVTEAPTTDCWPENGVVQYAYIDGQFVTSEYDCERLAEHVGPRSSLDFCFGDDRSGTIETTHDGGFMIYETDPNTGVILPDALVRVYNSDKRVVAYGDAVSLNSFRAGTAN